MRMAYLNRFLCIVGMQLTYAVMQFSLECHIIYCTLELEYLYIGMGMVPSIICRSMYGAMIGSFVHHHLILQIQHP